MDRKTNYRSQTFYDILTDINGELVSNDKPEISADMGREFASKYNVGKHGTTMIWRVTSKECPQLGSPDIMFKIQKRLKQKYPNYMDPNNKVITLGNPKYTTDNTTNQPLGSIVIMIAELEDNIITESDWSNYEQKDANTVEKCYNIESRMFKRADDTRDPDTRLADFHFSLEYEPLLVITPLKNIVELQLQHQIKFITLETDNKTDFTGMINNQLVKIESKSTRASVQYEDTSIGHVDFAKYFKDRLDSGSLGSIHNADYVLFILKNTGEVICIDINNLENNWLAGKLNF